MEDLQNHRPLRWLPFFLLLIYCHTGLSVSTDYTLPSEYFINCGSSDNVTVGQTTFVGDSGGKAVAGLSFTKKDSSTTTELLSSPTATLNHTARIFRASDSFYRFKITNKAAGTLYFLRLHFSAFSGKLNLSEAVFDVSVPGRKLLSNFTVKEGNSTVEEFLLPIDKSGEFRLLFQPIGTLSFAFVNAVEVFALPDGFISAESPRLTPQGPNGNYDSITSQVLHTRYRVNVGGLTIEPGDDTLLRSWVTDVEYIENLNASNTIPSVTVTYQPNTTNVTEYTAPRPVYSSARNMSVNSSGANITWSFNATVNATYLVRFHFCDIVSIARDSLSMSLYIFNGSRQVIYPYKNFSLRDDTRVPFKFDFVVESGPYPYIEISIGNDSSHHTVDAYLNGLEIMEMIGTWDSVSKSSSNEDRDKALIIGLSVGGALLFLFGMLALLGLKCRRPRNDAPEPSNWTRPDFYGLGSTQGGESGSDQTIGSPFLNFNLVVPLPEILSATKNFNEKLLIGEGGFGYVYSGTLRNQKVAVKRSYPGSSQGVSEFQTEIIVLSKIKHKHLVSLIGYCCERSEMILVYEFMEKGTLREHLYSSLPNPPLPWKQRLEICIGAARGLDYLHKGTSEGIIHRDVKSTNILLDHHFTAKVADFGLSKLEEMGHEQSQVSRGFKGTLGYLDPEYLSTQVLTEKSDVYAFGVVLLEVLCARPAIDPNLPREQMNLAEWVTANIDTGSVEKIIDPSIAGEINTNSLRKFADTALKCLQEDAQERPPMKDVIWDLEYALELQKSSAQMGLLDDNSTMTNGFSMSDFSASAIHKFPSIDMSIVEVGTSIPAADTDSEVFSQLQDGNGR